MQTGNMHSMGGRVELLAPAGNAEGFYGAVHAGADAVYLAGDRFGARAYAENFTTEELLGCVRYGHLLGRKIYLTVNTLLKEGELEELEGYLRPFYQGGVDAVIVQDLGVLRLIRERFPGWKIHVSTQMTICSGQGAALLKSLGASRIVPARELSLAELVQMKRQAGIEIEAFVHGAMCYCYSGQCLFSSILGGRSGNRGRCAQPCRLPYSVQAGNGRLEDRYPLSLKDMCTIEHIPELIEAGIDSFKIEGRMKKPEYAAGTTEIYRRYIDKYMELRERRGPGEAGESFRVEHGDLRALRSLYVRSGLQDGYYFRKNGREMVTMDSPAYSGSDEELLAGIRGRLLDKPLKLPVKVTADFQTGEKARIGMCWGQVSAWAEGRVVEQAQRQPITQENVRKQVSRLGDSAFYPEEIHIRLGGDCFYPLKEINELRRQAVERLEEQLLQFRGYGHPDSAGSTETVDGQCTVGQASERHRKACSDNAAYAFLVSTWQQLEAVADWVREERVPFRLYVEGNLLMEEWEQAAPLCRELSDIAAVYAALPYILREADSGYLETLYERVESSRGFKGFLARSMDGLGFLRGRGDMPCRADAGAYCWNMSAGRVLKALADGICLPYELNASEQRRLLEGLSREGMSCEKIVYGRIPMMITANCLYRTAGECRGGGSHRQALLKDRYRKEFPVRVDCRHCMNIIYNSVPLSLHQELSKWQGKAELRMDFTMETAAEVRRLLECFMRGEPFPGGDYTTGHEKRGVA